MWCGTSNRRQSSIWQIWDQPELLSYIGQIGKQMKRDSRQQNTDQDKIRGGRGSYITYRKDITLPLDTGKSLSKNKIRGGRGVIYYIRKRYNSAMVGHWTLQNRCQRMANRYILDWFIRNGDYLFK